jgi:hypothetical protein
MRAMRAALLAAAMLLVQQPGVALANDPPTTSAQKAARAKSIALAAKSAKQALAAKKAARKRYKRAADAEQLAYMQGKAAQAAYEALPANATPEERQKALNVWRGAHTRYASAFQEVQTSHYAMTTAVQQRKLLKHSLVSKKKETLATFIERSRMTGIFAQKGINVPQTPNYSPLRSQAEQPPSPSDLATPPGSVGLRRAAGASGSDVAAPAFRPSAPLNRRTGSGYGSVPGASGGPVNQRSAPGYATVPGAGGGPVNQRSAPGYASAAPDDPVNRRPGPGYANSTPADPVDPGPSQGYATEPSDDPVNRLPGPGYGSVDPRLRSAIKIFVPPPEPQY